MPAIVLVGAQWGDEGKGKATDLLGGPRRLRGPVPGREQRRSHRRHRRRERTPCTCCPSGILTPDVHPGDRQRRGGRPGGAARRARRAGQPAAWTPPAAALGRRAPDHAVPPCAGQGHRAVPGQRQDRHDRPRHRPDLRGQDGPDRASACRTCSTRASCGRRSTRRCGQKNQIAGQGLQPARWIDGGDRAEYRGYAERLRPVRRRHHAGCWTGRWTTARRCCSRARRARCSTSTTAPTRSSRRPTPPRAAPAPGRGIGPTRIIRVIGILKAYTTRVGEGPFPTELLDDDGECLRKAGGEYGVTTGRPRRCGWFDAVIARYATRVNGLTDFFLTKLDVLSGLDAGAGLRRLRGRRRADRRDADDPDRLPPRGAGVRVPRRLVGGHLQAPGLRRPAGRTRRAYVSAVEEMSGAPVSAIGVGPGRDQTLQIRDLLQDG